MKWLKTYLDWVGRDPQTPVWWSANDYVKGLLVWTSAGIAVVVRETERSLWSTMTTAAVSGKVDFLLEANGALNESLGEKLTL